MRITSDRSAGRGYARVALGELPEASQSRRLIITRQVQFMSTLPLKAMSRLWGKFNELDIPYYLRVPGFLLYSKIFGVKYVRMPSSGTI
jgi:hypothetical protein